MERLKKIGAYLPTLASTVFRCKAVLHLTYLSALFNGNPALPEIPEKGIFLPIESFGGVKVGWQADLVFQTDKHFNYQMYQGVVTANFIDRVEVFASLGTMKGKLNYPQNTSFHTSFDTTWGIGGRVLLIYWNQLVMGVNAQYQSARLDITKRFENTIEYTPRGKHLRYKDWQVGVGFAYHLDWVVPYLGLAYHAPHITAPNVTLDQQDPFSIYVGFTLTNDKYAEISFEGRMIGENGISLSGNVRF